MRNAPLVIGVFRTARGHRLASASQPRRSRRRLLLFCCAVLMLAGVLFASGRWLLTSQVFAVTRVESGPYRFSDRQDVEAAFSFCLGRNIWSLTRRDVVAASVDLPWVRDVRLKRRLPDAVVVDLIEWQPLLAVNAEAGEGGDRYLIADGRLLSLSDHLQTPVLPLLVGVRVECAHGTRERLRPADARAVLEVVDALAFSGFEGASPVDFVRLTPEGFVLVLQGRSGSLLLGYEDFLLRLLRYQLARPRIPEGSIVDLRFEDRITFVPAVPTRT